VRTMSQDGFSEFGVSPTHGQISEKGKYKKAAFQRFIKSGVKPGFRLVLDKK